MTDSAQALRVAVVGGGVIGVSTAAELARRGARITLVTEGPLASQASGRSLSWLNSFGLRSAAYHRLRMLGLDRYRILSTRVQSAAYLKFDGGLTWAVGDKAAGHREAFEHMRRIGYAAEWVDPKDVSSWTPGVNADAIPAEGSIFNPGEGWVELPPLIDHLALELTRHGGRVLTDAGRARVDLRGDRVSGVTTGTGERLPVDAVLLATGAEVPHTVAELGIEIPYATTVGLLVRTAPVATSLRAVLNTLRVAVRPTPYGSLVLDSGWSEREVVPREDGTYDVREETVQGLLLEASAVLEGTPQLPLASYGVGAKPIPGDGEPVFGPLPGVSGYHVAFTHSGATLGLIAGELLADEIVRGELHPLLAPFRPDRFC